jgi:hypothetical protein
MTVLLNPEFPKYFTRDQVVAALDQEAYRRTFKSETSIPYSVHWHLKELTKLGQLTQTITEADHADSKPAAPWAEAIGVQQQSTIPTGTYDADLLDMAREWYGYGRWEAPYWFIGPEPGMDPGEKNDLKPRCAAWIKLGAGELVDCKEHHFAFGCYDWHREVPPPPTQSTWRQLIRLLLAYRSGREPHIEDIRSYQQRFWGMRNGETCVIELCSLAANKLNVKKGANFDASSFREERIQKIRERISAYKPAFVVMYRTNAQAHWEAIAGGAFSSAPDVLTVGEGPTLAVFANHPVDSVGVSGSYWLQLAERLRNWREPVDEPKLNSKQGTT